MDSSECFNKLLDVESLFCILNKIVLRIITINPTVKYIFGLRTSFVDETRSIPILSGVPLFSHKTWEIQ